MTTIDLTKLSLEKQQLLKNCYYAILHADDSLVEKVVASHYSDDKWIEESISPQYPRIEVETTGISNTLKINSVDCMGDDYYENL